VAFGHAIQDHSKRGKVVGTKPPEAFVTVRVRAASDHAEDRLGFRLTAAEIREVLESSHQVYSTTFNIKECERARTVSYL
jgi:hypothetical protein